MTWVTQFNYLRYMFDSASKQQDKCEIEKRLRNMRIMGNVIATRIRHTSAFVKKNFFSTYFSNLYCMPLWIMSAKMLKTAQVAHNDCFRALFKTRGERSISELFQTANYFKYFSLSENDLSFFISSYNNFHPSLTYTYDTSNSSGHFLDIQIKIKNNKLLTTVYTKPTDSKNYLLYNSEHPKTTLNSIPYSQFLRVRRICILEQDFLTPRTSRAPNI